MSDDTADKSNNADQAKPAADDMRTRLILLGIVVSCLAAILMTRPAPSPEAWLQAVAANDEAKALELATRLVGDDLPAPAERYVSMAGEQEFDAGFLSASFNSRDFQLWRTAWYFQQQAKSLGEEPEPEAMLRLIADRLKETEDPIINDWPLAIWERGYGLCDRQSWVLCELAWQAGWETQIVYLHDKDHTTSPHTICELRKSDQVVLADPLSNKLLKRSLDTVVGDDALLRELWPDKPIWRDSLQYSMLWTPSFPADYCPRNQALYRVAAAALGDRCPRFGADPVRRTDTYHKLRRAEHERPRFTMGTWSYPFRLQTLQDGKQ